MTQRRPHWDDELIDDVFRLMDRYAAGVFRGEKNHGTPTFDTIAAVEDWQAQTASDTVRHLVARAERAEAERDRLANQLVNEVPDSYLQMKARALSAEAAIERVRELCQSAIDESYLTDASIARAGLADRILRALDGAS